MDTNTLPEQVAGGMDQRWFPAANAAQLVQNFRYDPNGGWRNDRGWEPLIPYDTPSTTYTPTALTDIFQPCRFLSIIQRHQGGEEYYLQERNGNLFYEWGNRGTLASGVVTLDKDRNIPRPDDAGTQAIPYGRFTALINGYDKMLKWWGRDVVEQFSFYQPPPAPTILEVQTDYNQDAIFPTTGSPTVNNLSGIAVQFDPESILGLGDPTGGAINSYSYRITYVTNTGSESPLSATASISWEIPTGEGADVAPNQKKYGVMLVGLEPGQNGVVARRIYRTKNKKNGITGAGDIFYFVGQIDDNNTTAYLDVVPDNQLTTTAPSVSDSTTISTSYKWGASWNGRFWLAGGESTPTRLIYSAQGLPEQFPAFNYFDVGVREGGHITALYPYYDVLLVFRERSIDAIFTNASGDGFTCTTVKKDCGTTATNTIKLIPGYGIVFLNKDGFWLIQGGMRGGAEISITAISQTIEKEMGRLSKNALARATAAYSDREKEYWCIYPVDGQTECSRGAAWNTINESWSLRNGDGADATRQWDFTQIATDQTGYFILGTRPKLNVAFPLLSNSYPGLGLQVWSGANSWGTTSTFVFSQGNYIVTPVEVVQGQSVWTSTWYDFGDDSVKKRAISVEVEVLTEGDNGIELQWAQDWDYAFNSAGTVKPQIGEVVGSAKEQPVYFPAPTGTPNVAVWDTSRWQDSKVTRMRWDVNTGLVSHFQFRLITSNRIQVVRFQINYIGGKVKTPNTRMPGAKQ
jgi:hypothetical protein